MGHNRGTLLHNALLSYMCMCHTKHSFSWEITRVITLLQNELESELAPEEGVVGSGHRLQWLWAGMSLHQEVGSFPLTWWRQWLPSHRASPKLCHCGCHLMAVTMLRALSPLSPHGSLRVPPAGPGNRQLLCFIFALGEIPKASAVHSSLVTLAFQEPCKKRSHQRSLKQQEGWACPPFAQLPIC